MKKVLVFLADGFEEIEALSVVDVLRRASLKCDLCSIKDEFVRGTHNIIIQSDCIIDNIDQDEYDAIVLPGGLPGADNLLDKRVKDIAIKFNDEGKIVAAICAAPQTLEQFGILDDKKCTSYPGFIKGREKVNYLEDQIVVVDKNIITSRGPATALEFAFKILEELGYKDKAEEIKKDMLVYFYLDHSIQTKKIVPENCFIRN